MKNFYGEFLMFFQNVKISDQLVNHGVHDPGHLRSDEDPLRLNPGEEADRDIAPDLDAGLHPG